MAALSAVMFALRPHLSIATVALVLVIPVIVGVISGGAWAGAVSVVAGFLVYDVVFIPPYGTLVVGRAQNWVSLGVYVVVLALLLRVTHALERARGEADARQRETERLFEVSELLVAERAMRELLPVVASTVQAAFGFEGVVVMLPLDDELEVAAAAGRPLSAKELLSVRPASGVLTALSTPARDFGQPVSVVLQVAGRPVGVLGAVGGRLDAHQWRLLRAFANHTAIALERAALADEAMRAKVLDEVDGFRQALLGAVSHDLRTPLASIKASASALADRRVPLSSEDSAELASLIEAQADRLSRMVSNLLELSRVQSGALVLKRNPVSPRALVRDALDLLHPPSGSVVLEGLDGLPAVDVDAGLVTEAIVNLVDNGLRFAPAGSQVRVAGATVDGLVTVSVVDRGPGVAPELRGRLFEGPLPEPMRAHGGSGLGLVIVKAFVEANGGTVTLGDEPGGGTRAVVALPPYEAGSGGAPDTDDESLG